MVFSLDRCGHAGKYFLQNNNYLQASGRDWVAGLSPAAFGACPVNARALGRVQWVLASHLPTSHVTVATVRNLIARSSGQQPDMMHPDT